MELYAPHWTPSIERKGLSLSSWPPAGSGPIEGSGSRQLTPIDDH